MKHETLDTSFRLASPSCPLVFDAYADDFSAGGFYTVNLFFSEDNLDSVYGPPAKVRESTNFVPSPQFLLMVLFVRRQDGYYNHCSTGEA